MNAVETLRKAAALMRERAEAATPGPWRQVEVESRRYGHEYVITTDYIPTGGARPRILDADGWSEGRDTTYAASMHPAVALAVADWLDLVAKLLDQGFNANAETTCAVAVATAYLGEGDR